MGLASVGAEGGSCDALGALRLSRSPNRTTINPAQLPIVQSTRTPARLSAPRATATEVIEDVVGAVDWIPCHQANEATTWVAAYVGNRGRSDLWSSGPDRKAS